MDTKEAYEAFKAGRRIAVKVTNGVDGTSTYVEIDEVRWLKRLKRVPDNTNYVELFNDGRIGVLKDALRELSEKAVLADLYLNMRRCKHCARLIRDDFCCPHCHSEDP